MVEEDERRLGKVVKEQGGSGERVSVTSSDTSS